jgi:type I restriction enzyme S subunit
MVDSGTEYGIIPKDWEVKRFDAEIELAYGKALKEENRKPGTILVCGSGGIVGTHNEKLVSGPGVVIGRKGNAGTVFWVNEDFYPIDTAFFVKTKLNLVFAFYLLKTQNFVLGDAAVPGLNREQAYRNKILLPEKGLINQFAEKVEPVRKLIGMINDENSTLSKTRDLLIPQMITGRRELK